MHNTMATIWNLSTLKQISFFSFWVMFVPILSYAQIPDTIFFEEKVTYLNFDNQLNYYVITQRNELKKYDSKGKFITNFRAQTLGKIGFVDVSNPLSLVVFYPNLGRLLLLDNMLYQKAEINLESLNLSEQNIVCRSFDNNFWVYDDRNFRLKKLAKDFNTVVEGEWLINKFEQDINPVWLQESGDKVYMRDQSLGIIVFDLYGKYQKTIALPDSAQVQLFQNQLIVFAAKGITQINTETWIEKFRPFVQFSYQKELKYYRIENKLGILYQDLLILYPYTWL